MIFLLGLLARLLLIFVDFAWDVNNHISWAKDLFIKGPIGFYDIKSTEVFASLYPNYPPLANFLFYFFYTLNFYLFKFFWWLNLSFSIFPSKIINFVQSREFLAGVLKIPSVAADIGIAYMCFLFAKKLIPNNKKIHALIPIFILFNPALFYNSSLWGQIDSIPIFFALVSLYLLLFNKRYLLSFIFFTFGLLVKPTVLIYLPIYIFILIKNKGFAYSIKTLFISNLVFWFSFLPFYKEGSIFLYPYLTYFKKIILAQSLPFTTNGAYNFWALVTLFNQVKDTDVFLFNLSFRVWGYLLTSASFLIIYFLYLKSNMKNQNIIYGIFLGAYASFLFLTKMHERYLMLPLVILALVCIFKKEFWKWFVVLSFLSLLNLYNSWPRPQFGISTNTYLLIPCSILNMSLFLYFLLKNKFNAKD